VKIQYLLVGAKLKMSYFRIFVKNPRLLTSLLGRPKGAFTSECCAQNIWRNLTTTPACLLKESERSCFIYSLYLLAISFNIAQ